MAALPPHSSSPLHGVWRKNTQGTDLAALHRAMDAMRLSRVQKTAALRLINGIHLQIKDDAASIEYLTSYPIPFKLQEQYRRNSETIMARRDQRRGHQRAVLKSLQPHEMAVELWWDGDLPGRVQERFVLNEATDELEVHGVMEIQGGRYEVVQRYRKESA